jgi:trans-2,3-dihydro-3-hydroxyanthranilate isomerase
MRRYRYYICDVFTDQRFGGNPLAVLPEADGLSDVQMQQIAREFNFSESTFVFPSNEHTRKVRIFTPATEVPFAGHPNVGTAFALAAAGEFGEVEASKPITVTFEEKAGLVPVTVRRGDAGAISCELTAPQQLAIGKAVSAETAAGAVSLSPDDVLTTTHPPQMASVGLPFLVAELSSRSALERARADMDGIARLASEGVPPDVHLYVQSGDEFDLRARMFAPLDGVPEDPATGSANCALAALLTHYRTESDGRFEWRIAQGVEMGRPSVLGARTEKKGGRVLSSWIGGTSVLVAEGLFCID